MRLLNEVYKQDRNILERGVTKLEDFVSRAPQVVPFTPTSDGPYDVAFQHSLGRKPDGVFVLGAGIVQVRSDQQTNWSDSVIYFTYTGQANAAVRLMVW